MNRWEYLLTPAFQSRYVLAAYHVRNCDTIVEIGGWKNCIADYLPELHEIIAIDPLAEGRPDVELIKEPLQNVDMSFLREENFGLVFMGFELVGERSTIAMDKIVDMADRARVVVLEYATKHSPSVGQVEMLLHRCQKRVYLRLALDISGSNLNLSADSFPPFYERMFLVLKDNV